jgi:hypothetical protein
MTNEKCLAFGETTGSEKDEKKAIMAGAIKFSLNFFSLDFFAPLRRSSR